MLVWNEFAHDARVTREAVLLIENGADVQVTGILSKRKPAQREISDEGIRVRRVSRENPWLSRLVFLPRYLIRRVRQRLQPGRVSVAPFGPVRWWQVDRRLVFLLEELGVNWRMFRSARDFSPHVVHAHDVNTLVPAWLAARRSGARLVYDAHEISADREGYDGRVWLVKLVEWWLGRDADARITTTQARANWFQSTYGYPDMTVLQNRPVRDTSTRTERIRCRFSIPWDEPIVLYQGGLQWGRGLSNLLEAMRGLPQAHLVFVGDGAQRPVLESEAADMAARVHFVGQVALADLPGWTASADIGVQTLRNTCLNHYTTDSNKLFEYVMGGLPVVASDFPEIRAIVTQWDLGLLVDPHDVGAVREALRQLIEDGDARKHFASNALRARSHLDWNSEAPKLLALYRSLMS